MEKKTSIKDIAAHLGVSTALVSYVLNGKEKEARVGAAMVAKIRRTAKKLNYQPNLIARSLKSGRTNTIGLIVADISNPFFSNIARIIEDEAKKQQYVVIFGSSDESADKQQDLINVFLNRQVDGFIIAPAMATERQILSLQKKSVPVVLIDRYFNGMEVDSVHIDNSDAANKAVQHLVNNGCSRIAMVAYHSSLQHMQERMSGYKAALKKNNIRFKREWLVQVSYNSLAEDVAKGVGRLIEPLKIDAVLFATNSLAVAGLKIINEAGIIIPDQLAIVSFDESEVFDFFYSPVTYVSQSVLDIGKEAVAMTVKRIAQNDQKTVNRIINTTLLVRKSSVSGLARPRRKKTMTE